MELSTRYQSKETEDKWYSYWEKAGYFKSVPDHREAFSIVIPPPNVTGVLHMGHMLNNTIQDILIRKARLDGKNACWVPGTDHASIATEAKVVRMLREQGIKKSDISREEFLKFAWEWKEKYGGIILQQLRKLGASCDWDRTAFTMDIVRSEGVYKVFVDLYKKGKIYRGKRMVHWDPEAKTVLSNEEVLHSEEQSKLYHIAYKVAGDPSSQVVIATQRPETIMADTAVAVNSKDPRYTHLKGKQVIIPLINKAVPIIFDDYVDPAFGTGALKVTPAHDQNDYEIGIRHQLEVIDILHEDGRLNDLAQILVGEDRFVARKKIGPMLEEAGLLIKTEDYVTNIGRSERTNTVVEPRLSLQWYVNMKSLADPALEVVVQDVVAFIPEQFKNTYRHWMENIRDWCISRQLWWGHRIPAWYIGDHIIVEETAEEALVAARKILNDDQLQISDLRQDEDVLDTWFSSWLWPITVFDGFKNKQEIDYYYPTSVLVTGWDIIFLWVARMIMAGMEWKQEIPFHKVYFTGMVRDKQRRKMSKSLGNSPDALGLIDEFGADGVRFGILASSPAGGDLLFDDKLCEQGRNFSNKLWNALRLIKTWEEQTEDIDFKPMEQLAIQWFDSSFQHGIEEVQQHFEKFRLSDALMRLYQLIWDDFCAWYLEMVKANQGEKLSRAVYDASIGYFEQICIALHPFMPFVTEEIWHYLKGRTAGDDCIIQSYPKVRSYDHSLLKAFDVSRDLVRNIREIRAKHQLKNTDRPDLHVDSSFAAILEQQGIPQMIQRFGLLNTVKIGIDERVPGISFLIGTYKMWICIEQKVDIQQETQTITAEITRLTGFANGISAKLSNEKFLGNAKPEVIEMERKKHADAMMKIEALTERMKSMNQA